jgi:hypothetical protein
LECFVLFAVSFNASVLIAKKKCIAQEQDDGRSTYIPVLPGECKMTAVQGSEFQQNQTIGFPVGAEMILSRIFGIDSS